MAACVLAMLACAASARPSGFPAPTRFQRSAPFAEISVARTLLEGHEACPEMCPMTADGLIPAPDRSSPWMPPSVEEQTAIEEYLLSVPELDLSAYTGEGKQMWENTIYRMELHAPVKEDTLAYLAGDGPFPDRYMKVTILQGKSESILELLVPVGDPTSYEVYAQYGLDAWLRRPPTSMEYSLMEEIIAPVLSETLATLIEESYGGYTYAHDCEKCLTWADTSPVNFGSLTRGAWVWTVKDVLGFYSFPVGLELYIDRTASDASEWSVTTVYYAGKIYESPEALAAAYASGGIPKVTKPIDPVEETDYNRGSFNLRKPVRQGSEQPGPAQFEPAGNRYLVDGNKVSWLGWTFDAVINPVGGLGFFDVKFKDESIAYEIALKEALAYYGGTTPAQQSSMYLDTWWGLGLAFRELVDGVDCPAGSTYITMPTYKFGSYPLNNCICVFEHNNGIPLRRHDDQYYDRYDGLTDNILIVRAMSTVYNYDYLVDLRFHANGVIEQQMHASGYPQSMAFEQPEKDGMYGFKLNQYAGGTIHIHNLAWKLDLDIAGVQNTFEKHYIKVKSGVNEYTGRYTDMPYLEHEYIENEDDAKVVMEIQKPIRLTFVNEGQTNQWGSTRGYLLLNKSPVHHVLPETNPILNMSPWVKYHVLVTKRKESEQSVSTIFNGGSTRIGPSIASSASFTDSENIRDEDLCVWVNIGNWHVPVAEDNPVTTTPGGRHAWVLKPFNFASQDMSTDMAGLVSLEPGPDGTAVNTNELYPEPMACFPDIEPKPFGRWGAPGDAGMGGSYGYGE